MFNEFRKGMVLVQIHSEEFNHTPLVFNRAVFGI